MAGLIKVQMKGDFKGLEASINEYVKVSGRSPQEVLQKQAPKLTYFLRTELANIAPKPSDISLQHIAAQNKRVSRKRRSRVSVYSQRDAASGRTLGLKIRKSVHSEAMAKFKQASTFNADLFTKGGGKVFDAQVNFNGVRGKDGKLRKRRTSRRVDTGFGMVKRKGVALSISAWMVAREIAVRRSSTKFLAHGYTHPKLRGKSKKGEETPKELKLVKFQRNKHLAGKVEMKHAEFVSTFRALNTVPGIVTVDGRRQISERAIKQVSDDIRIYLLRKQREKFKQSFKRISRQFI